jgi:hypothetical protein
MRRSKPIFKGTAIVPTFDKKKSQAMDNEKSKKILAHVEG